jgi:hypothetical protein
MLGETMKMFAGLPCRKLVGWFLILWGATFLFSAIWGFAGLLDYSVGYLIIELLWDLADLGIAGVLVILGLKVLNGDCFGRMLPEA